MHLSHLKPFVAQSFAPASYGRNLSGRATANGADRVPAISDRDGNFSRGSRNPRNRPNDSQVSPNTDGASIAQGLFSQLINWELGSADGRAASEAGLGADAGTPKSQIVDPSIYDLLALVAPPLT